MTSLTHSLAHSLRLSATVYGAVWISGQNSMASMKLFTHAQTKQKLRQIIRINVCIGIVCMYVCMCLYMCMCMYE